MSQVGISQTDIVGKNALGEDFANADIVSGSASLSMSDQKSVKSRDMNDKGKRIKATLLDSTLKSGQNTPMRSLEMVRGRGEKASKGMALTE